MKIKKSKMIAIVLATVILSTFFGGLCFESIPICILYVGFMILTKLEEND